MVNTMRDTSEVEDKGVKSMESVSEEGGGAVDVSKKFQRGGEEGE